MPKSIPKVAKAAKPSAALLKQPVIALDRPNPPLGYELKLDPEHPYLKERGLSPETIARFGLGYCANGPLAGRIAIPVHSDRGVLVGYVGRWPGDPPERRSKYRFLNKHWTHNEVFNLHRVLQTPIDWPLILVQGFFDVMKLWQLGCERAVAIMGGIPYSDQLEMILWHRPSPAPIIVLFDETDNGHEARDVAVSLLARHTYVRYRELRNGLRPEDLTAEDVEHLCGVGKVRS